MWYIGNNCFNINLLNNCTQNIQYTVSVLGRDKIYPVKYSPLPEGAPEGKARALLHKPRELSHLKRAMEIVLATSESLHHDSLNFASQWKSSVKI